MEKIKKLITELKTALDDYKPTTTERGLVFSLRRGVNMLAAAVAPKTRVKTGGEDLAARLNPKFITKQPPRKDEPIKKPTAGALLATSDDVKTPSEQLQEVKQQAAEIKKTSRRGRPRKTKK